MSRFGFALLLAAAACGNSARSDHSDAHGSGDDDAGPLAPDAFAGPWTDFPMDPIVETGAPAGANGLFGDPAGGTATGGPCLIEPEIGTLFPNNWLRPRFTWTPGSSENLFEIRITTPNETNPLVVYTTATTWTMPANLWGLLSLHIIDQPINVSIRGAHYDAGTMTLTSGPEHGSAGNIAIAPSDAPGAIVYWTTTGVSRLRGFHIGDESVSDIVTPSNAGSACIGCHASTPDGMYVGFSSSNDGGNGDPTMLGLLTADGTAAAPPFLTPSAQQLMARTYQEQPSFSINHWQTGDHTALNIYTNGDSQLMWTDLEATSTAQGTGWGFIPRINDPYKAAYASFAHTSDTILYVSAPAANSGVTVHEGDLATVPYNNRAGGTYTPVLGAATTDYNEYYPTFSPDDRYIAFNRVPNGQSSYNNSLAEVYVVPAAGGFPVRIAANDPPQCGGRTSPGVTNSWPKWAPGAVDANGKRYYWLTFSSTRTGGNPQLFVTPVVDDGTQLTTYPALYLWNQPAAENNHTPAWDNFSIPIQ